MERGGEKIASRESVVRFLILPENTGHEIVANEPAGTHCRLFLYPLEAVNISINWRILRDKKYVQIDDI